jgi:hypothetical protein
VGINFFPNSNLKRKQHKATRELEEKCTHGIRGKLKEKDNSENVGGNVGVILKCLESLELD